MSPRCAVQHWTVAKTLQTRRSRGAAILTTFANTIGTLAVRFITANLNGIRSAANKGFFDWLPQQQADAVGVQEVKAQGEHVDGVFCSPDKLKGHFHYAQKKGYSGVGLYTRVEPSDLILGFGVEEFDFEGRWVEKRFDKPGRRLSLISCYFPSGSSGPERQEAKFRFLAAMYPHLMALKAEREFILVADVNIAHKEADLKNWKGNLKNSGFLPEERAWMTQLTDAAQGGLVDVYRALQPDTTDACYTWWSNRGEAYAKNVGWRLDYHLATPGLAALAKRESIYKAQKFSDHAPLTIDYDFKL
ncbi:MAG: exodeoxyribonuclease III [Burkholderiaceae bacterium]|nr:exodeoxyribonuclease III [Burkholderiaceae bacterium]